MRARSIYMVMVVVALLAGCVAAEQPRQAEPVQFTATIAPTAIMPPTNTLAPTRTMEPTATIVSSFCDYDQAMKVVARLEEITATGSGNSQETGEPTEAQIKEILAAFDEKLSELDQMQPPECLELSVALLRVAWVDLRALFAGEMEDPEEALALLVRVSEEQAAFEVEFSRVKACIPSGCR